MSVIPKKPPAQIAGVVGIAPRQEKDVTPGAVPINLGTALAHPPFQMFCAENWRNTEGKDAISHAKDVTDSVGWGATLWDTYCRWHAEKGYWPDETPSGEVKKNA